MLYIIKLFAWSRKRTVPLGNLVLLWVWTMELIIISLQITLLGLTYLTAKWGRVRSRHPFKTKIIQVKPKESHRIEYPCSFLLTLHFTQLTASQTYPLFISMIRGNCSHMIQNVFATAWITAAESQKITGLNLLVIIILTGVLL